MVDFLHLSDIHIRDKQGDLWNGVDPCKNLEKLIELAHKLEAKVKLSKAWNLDGHIHPETYIRHFAKIGETERAREILVDSQQKKSADPGVWLSGYG